MKKLFLKHGLLAAIVVVSAFTIVPLTVSAETTSNEMTREATIKEHHETAQKEAEARREAAKTKLDTHREATKTRLQDAKLRACENRQKAITNTMSRIADRGQKQLDLFSRIAERTQAFYEKKGKTLANYDALVADVAIKKEAAQAAVATAKSHGASFDCGGVDPKGAANSFKEHSKTGLAALKEYKTSVKNLIVGVKSVQRQAASESEQK